MNIEHIATAAEEHARNLRADISNASTRIEQIRLTQLAVEAEQLAIQLRTFANQAASPGTHPEQPVLVNPGTGEVL